MTSAVQVLFVIFGAAVGLGFGWWIRRGPQRQIRTLEETADLRLTAIEDKEARDVGTLSREVADLRSMVINSEERILRLEKLISDAALRIERTEAEIDEAQRERTEIIERLGGTAEAIERLGDVRQSDAGGRPTSESPLSLLGRT